MRLLKRQFSTVLDLREFCRNPNLPTESIRNTGIIAHIDAGKTTTTERMLFYAGVIARIGNVDQGNTVTDYLEQEKERGITITSATMTFPWKKHKINLIDTPGHVDFSIEVSRSLRVLDSAIIILDARKGVESQTETVWKQAAALPKILYINKFDKEDCYFKKTFQRIAKKARNIQPTSTVLALQVPILPDDWVGSECMNAVIDLVTFSCLEWTTKDGDAIVVHSPSTWLKNIRPLLKGSFVADLFSFRMDLFEFLAEHDEDLLTVYLENAVTVNDPLEAVSNSVDNLSQSNLIAPLIRRLVIKGVIIPVLAGASFKNWGVQPLLDAVIEYLPCPNDVPLPILRSLDGPRSLMPIPVADDPLVALAFKVIVDPRRGPLVFVRVYSGILSSKMTLYNATSKKVEKSTRLVQMLADDPVEIHEIRAGNIGVILGCKETRTGDTLMAGRKTSNSLVHSSSSYQLDGIAVPPAVFFCSAEADSPSDEALFLESLRTLALEDPSFKFEVSDETGQLIISGLGELHLEIIRDRLLRNFKCKVNFGQIKIAYRESLVDQTQPLVKSIELNQVASGGNMLHVNLQISLEPIAEFQLPSGPFENEVLVSSYSVDSADLSGDHIPQFSKDDLRHCVESQAFDSLRRGPLKSFPMTKLRLTISDVQVFADTTLPAVRYAVNAAVKSLFKENKERFEILEPIAHVTIRVRYDFIGAVLSDLSACRRGHVLQLLPETSDEDNEGEIINDAGTHVIEAEIPFAELMGYSSSLRRITAGNSSFSIQIKGFRPLPFEKQVELLK